MRNSQRTSYISRFLPSLIGLLFCNLFKRLRGCIFQYKEAEAVVNEKKIQQWGKWHHKGYMKFMLLNMAGVCAFYAFTGTIAILQLSMNKPKGTSLLTIIVPGILIIALLVPAAFIFMHVAWKMKEKQYVAYLQANQPEPVPGPETEYKPEGEEHKCVN